MNKTFQYDMSPACLQITYHELCASNAKTLHTDVTNAFYSLLIWDVL